MKCQNCKNYEPVQATQKPETTVTVWFPPGKPPFEKFFFETVEWEPTEGDYSRGCYSFSGLPDIDRVIRETLDKGALAVKVVCSKKFDLYQYHLGYSCGGVYLWDKRMGDCGEEDVEGSGATVQDKYYGWSWYGEPLFITDASIDAAVTKYLEGKKPKEPKFKVGDVVQLFDGGSNLGEVIKVDGEMLDVKWTNDYVGSGKFPDILRLATPAEVSRYEDAKYTRWYGKLGIRAYDDQRDHYPIGLYFSDKTVECLKRKSGTAICAAISLPIYTLAAGEEPVYPLAKGEK